MKTPPFCGVLGRLQKVRFEKKGRAEADGPGVGVRRGGVWWNSGESQKIENLCAGGCYCLSSQRNKRETAIWPWLWALWVL